MTSGTTGQPLTKSQEYYAKNREAHLERCKKARIAYKKTPWGKAKHLVADARKSAKKRGLPHTIEAEVIAAIIEEGTCQLTGMPFILETGETLGVRIHPASPSLDRIDPNKGYTPENVQVVCWAINALMHQWPTHISRVYAKAFLNATNGVKS